MSKPIYTLAAQQDLADIVEYISRDKPQAAWAWLDKIEAKCLVIAEQPSMGDLQPHFGEDVRASVVGRYVVFHRRREDRLEILRVIAGDRDIQHL
jgi:toxin ParE1/3/4